MDIIKKLLLTFIFINTGILISTALFITIFFPETELNVSILWQIISLAFVCALGNLIYYIKKVPTKKQMRVFIICHYLYINIVVFVAALLYHWLTPGLIPEILVMLLLVAAVYVIIMLVNFRKEEKFAEFINRQLRQKFPTQEEDEYSK